MLAIDANVVVRYLVGDDPIQAKSARCVVDENEVLVSDTVAGDGLGPAQRLRFFV